MHADQAKSACLRRGVKAAAVVLDGCVDAGLVFLDLDRRSSRPAVLLGVGERFLDDPVDRGFELGGVPVGRAAVLVGEVDGELDVEAVWPRARSARSSIAALVPSSSSAAGRRSVISARRLPMSLSSWATASRTASVIGLDEVVAWSCAASPTRRVAKLWRVSSCSSRAQRARSCSVAASRWRRRSASTVSAVAIAVAALAANASSSRWS